MIEFKSLGWYRIKVRGTGYFACVVSGDQLPPNIWDPSQLTDKAVMIDGEDFVVALVEKYMIGISPTNPYRLQFTILVWS